MIKRLAIACVTSVALLLATVASASGNITASHAWIRLLPGTLPAAAYVQLHNDGDSAAQLTSASSNAFAMVMLHQSTREDGVEHMSMVDGVDIPAHANATLAPGGYHLMLMHRVHELTPGDTVTVDLKFADGSTLAVPFKVRPANASSADE